MTSPAATTGTGIATPPKATEVEVHGVEPIPDAERSAGPLDLFRLIFGGANTIATVVLGTFPIIFGLSFRDALLATLAGLLLGAAILAPMSLFGPRNGTNNAVSSSAHLGVHGRVVGSFLSLLTAVAFFSISVWTSGDVLVGGANRAMGLPDSDIAVGVAYGVFALLVLVVCIYGFRFMLLVNKIAVIAATLLFLAGIVAFGGTFDAGYPGTLVAGDPLYWPSFVGAALIVMSNPVSFGAFLGDWARYIPRETPSWKPMLAAFLAQIATLVPFLFGLVTATVVATTAPGFIDDGDYVGGLLEVSPGWYFVPVCLIALIGGMSTGTTALYGTGLDFSSVFPRFSRVQATVFIGTLAIVFIFVGRFAFNVVQSISTFAVLIVTCTAPWMVVMMLGWFTRRGWYDSDALQVFNRRQRGGRYWFAHGWNWRGLGAWLIAAALSICFVNLPGQFVGPLGNLAAGVDLSIPVGLGVAAILYPVLLWAFPEPADVFGPAGPRAVPAGPAANTPIVSEEVEHVL
ncbi:nitrate reductase [Mycolicibacterium chubuense]|uniref:Permease for cytosine/purine, uracil, thiamine, allantoin n=1 Tax=Mycolicibacterium chubuense TaxID=1800 RepID=A0A0J6WJH4_MYCCU|nr:cytosine permease [Mycolicibacterium chubuense]KMO82128.1 Permease for cytosine/purine, uracil, thiamine, allantoin [Mycolicibacterium chubuense]ORA42941.1 nitrate reductase [Mycolicibacterium chubuense]SPX99921.1 permease for cytosine/purines uracil thiamine allantoin [Mycolicibacterium chubuense]